MSEQYFTLRKGADVIHITVLENGMIKLETDKISAPNHAQAEAFELDLAKEGKTTRKQRSGHTHAHGHQHEHEHQ